MIKSPNLASQLIAGTAAILGIRHLMRRLRRRYAQQSESEARYLAARRKILVIGAGFGGLAAVLHLDRTLRDQPDTSILLVDRDNNLFFTPLLWTVSDGRSNPNSVVVPIRDLQRGRRFHVLHAEVRRIDLERRQVETTAGPKPYDLLVVDCGSVTAVPDLPGVRKRALLFRTPVEALQLRN